MKTVLSILLIIFSVNQLFPQGFYPLHKGNIWQYQSSDPMYPEFWEAKIIGDTTMYNGKSYARFTGSGLSSNFLRQENSKVFAYNNRDSTEYVLFDFSANVNDTISQRSNGKSTIVLKHKNYDSTTHRMIWTFVDYFGDSLYNYDFSNWFITDSIGLTSSIVEPGNRYHLTGALINGKIIAIITNVYSNNLLLPESPALYQNYPNPFNPTTTIKFIIPQKGYTIVKIYNLLGQQVATLVDEVISSGEHIVNWNATDYPTGIYFYKLETNKYSVTKKLLLIK